MHIADLRDRVTVQRGRQVSDGHFDFHDTRTAACIHEANDSHEHRSAGGDLRRDARHERRISRWHEQRRDGQRNVTQEREHEQRGEEAHHEQASPGEAIGPGARQRPGHHAERHQHVTADEQSDPEGATDGADRQRGQQPHADIHMQQSQQGRGTQEGTTDAQEARNVGRDQSCLYITNASTKPSFG